MGNVDIDTDFGGNEHLYIIHLYSISVTGFFRIPI